MVEDKKDDVTFDTWLTDEERLLLASLLMSPGFVHYATVYEKNKLKVYVNGIIAFEKINGQIPEEVK